MGAMDFAGGIVIHTTSGVGALVISMYLHKRKLSNSLIEAGSHNLTLTVIGSVIIWAGWFSFVINFFLIKFYIEKGYGKKKCFSMSFPNINFFIECRFCSCI